MITRAKLLKIFHKASDQDVTEFYNVFTEHSEAFMIDKEVLTNFFLAQVVAETGYGLSASRENLNYTPDALRSTFSYYKKNTHEATLDGRTDNHSANQPNIGNKAYANRIGNGDVESGDGYRFRGGGYFQLTGRANYNSNAEIIQMTIGEAVDAENIESEITTVTMGLLSAMAFWLENKCYHCYHIDCVTEKINEYTDTYGKRKDIYQWIAGL